MVQSHAIFYGFVLDIEKALKGDFFRLAYLLLLLLFESFRFRAEAQVSLKRCFIFVHVYIRVNPVFVVIIIGWIAHVGIVIAFVVVVLVSFFAVRIVLVFRAASRKH